MSTILKALRRLEQEKAATAPGRPLREEVAHGLPSEPAATRRWAPAAAALLVGLGIGAAIFAWMSGGEAPPAVASAPEAAPAVARAPALPAPNAPAPALPLAPEGGIVSAEELGALFGRPPEDDFDADVEVVARPEALPRLVDPSPVEPALPPKPGQRRPVEDSSAARRARQALSDAAAAGAAPRPAPSPEQVRALAAAQAQPPAPEPAREPEPVARAIPEPEPAPVEKRVEPAPAPVEPAPAPPKPVAKAEPRPPPAPPPAPLPSLRVEKTLWHPQPERRRAWLRLEGEAEAQQVVEGDVIGGLLVAEIEPSGVVLERDGERIERGLGGR